MQPLFEVSYGRFEVDSIDTEDKSGTLSTVRSQEMASKQELKELEDKRRRDVVRKIQIEQVVSNAFSSRRTTVTIDRQWTDMPLFWTEKRDEWPALPEGLWKSLRKPCWQAWTSNNRWDMLHTAIDDAWASEIHRIIDRILDHGLPMNGFQLARIRAVTLRESKGPRGKHMAALLSRLESAFPAARDHHKPSTSPFLRIDSTINPALGLMDCEFCGWLTVSWEMLLSHLNEYHTEGSFHCPVPGCDKAIASLYDFDEHLKQHAGWSRVELLHYTECYFFIVRPASQTD